MHQEVRLPQRAIDAAELLRELDLAPDEWMKGRTIEAAILRVPILDCVPVVRCKDCEHSRLNILPGYEGQLRCDHPNLDFDIECADEWINVNPSDYCSKGIPRKENCL